MLQITDDAKFVVVVVVLTPLVIKSNQCLNACLFGLAMLAKNERKKRREKGKSIFKFEKLILYELNI